MNILGNRVYLDMPDIKESNFSISDDLKKELKEKELRKFDKLTVFGVGDTVTNVKKGDIVFLDPNAVRSGIITVNIDGKDKIITSIFNIAHIW